MSRAQMSLLTVALCGVAVIAGQGLLSWSATAGTNGVAIPNLNGIDALQFKGHGDVEIVSDGAASLTITDGNSSNIKVTRDGATLVITVSGWFAGDPHFVLHTTPLRNLELSGSVDLTADQLTGKEVGVRTSGSTEVNIDKLSADVVTIHTSGASELTANGVATAKLAIEGNGSSEINLKGNATEQDARFSGSSEYDAMGLISDRVSLHVSGAIEAKVHAVKQLNLEASGGSEITYAGEPSIVQHISGSVELEHVAG